VWQYALTWHGRPEDLLVTARGEVTPAAVEEYTRAVLDDPRFRTGMLILIDYREADTTSLDARDIEERLQMMTRDAWAFEDSKFAIVVGRPVDFGIMRMLHQRGDLLYENSDASGERRIFYTLEEARAWLARFRDAEPQR
jgi:hypothetical protein